MPLKVAGPVQRGTISSARSPATGIYKMLKKYATLAGVHVDGLCLHALRATAALEHAADLAYMPEWLGHANIYTTRLNDRRRSRREDSPTFRVSY